MKLVLNYNQKILCLIGFFFSLLYLFILLQKRIPFAHDTFQYLQLQYLYFNEIVQGRSVPIWFPFLTHGITSNFYFTPQLNILVPVYYVLGLFQIEVNYLYLFYFLIWFEEIFFLAGVILLSSLYYKDKKTIFFVSLTLLGTDIWYPQVWWNFHLYYFIPIVLYCIHKCLLTGYFRYLLLALIFSTLAIYGNFIYCIIFVSFVILSYIIFLTIVDFESIKAFFLKNIKIRNGVALLILFFIMFLSFSYITYGAGEIAYLGARRGISGGISLNTFLTFGGSIGLSKYKEIFIRYGDSMDINLYAGYLLIPFAVISFAYAKSRLSHAVGGISLLLFLFSIGVIVSQLFYYLYPFGNVFRHIGLTATVFKLFIVFYAGFGFEQFLKRMHIDTKLIFSLVIYLVVLVSLLIVKPPLIDKGYFWFILPKEKTLFLVSMYFTMFLSIIIFWVMYKSNIKRRYLVNMLLLLIAVDLFSYKYSLIVTRMPSVPESVIELFNPYKYSFPEKRLNIGYLNPRSNVMMGQFDSTGFFRGATYNSLDAFMFVDFVKSRFRTDFMLKPVKDFSDVREKFPNKADEAYRKYSGDNYPKLAAFSRLNVAKDISELGDFFSQADFTGDMLFTTEKDVREIRQFIPVDSIGELDDRHFSNLNERIPIDIKVKDFSFNSLKLQVFVDGLPGRYYFLYYSDAYHPNWNAYVNGTKTNVIKSNIGYKSIMVPYGSAEIVFTFGNIFYYISNVCTLLVLSAVLCSAIYIFITEFGAKLIMWQER